ncbi:hypothetical protein [uncultured Polaribacter sp.]|uniref:hypothetical protein n=1 Tax=uncultured Polaribacter sp. TaxID=174711 RepID=UPI002603DF85|nr:hypothetical protein [uncultured Polaribacter sp.]
MKAKENEFLIDTLIFKYQSLSKKEKSIINLCLGMYLLFILIGNFYSGGKVLGEFLYIINH